MRSVDEWIDRYWQMSCGPECPRPCGLVCISNLIKQVQSNALEEAAELCWDHQCTYGRNGCLAEYSSGALCANALAKDIDALIDKVQKDA